MNPQQYIQSGAIESCILGLADEKDKALLEEMERLYPEVLQARKFIEADLNKRHQTAEKVAEAPAAKPVQSQPPPARDMLVLQSPAFTSDISEDEAEKLKAVSRLKSMLTISFFVLMVVSGLLLYNYSLYSTAKSRYEELLAQQNALVVKNETMMKQMAMMQNPDVKQASLRTASAGDRFSVPVFWNARSKEVYVITSNLPAPDKGRQYQLWVQQNGMTQDAGMIGWNQDAPVVKMHEVERADGFFITLENEGGSQTPNLKALVARGGW